MESDAVVHPTSSSLYTGGEVGKGASDTTETASACRLSLCRTCALQVTVRYCRSGAALNASRVISRRRKFSTCSAAACPPHKRSRCSISVGLSQEGQLTWSSLKQACRKTLRWNLQLPEFSGWTAPQSDELVESYHSFLERYFTNL